MDVNTNDLISIKEILSDVLVALDDEGQAKLTPGFYMATVKNSLDSIGFDIPFLEVVTDTAIPDDLILDIPSGCYNLKAINIYTGEPSDVKYVENVYWRKGFKTQGKETGGTANINAWNTTDPFFRVAINEWSLYYFSIQRGNIYLSDACEYFDYVRLVYNGLPSTNLSVVAMVPREIRDAVVTRTIKKCATALLMKDKSYANILMIADRDLDEFGLNGSWHLAKQRLLNLDSKKLRDAIEYRSKMNY